MSSVSRILSRGLIALLVAVASATSLDSASWSRVDNADEYRLCWTIFLQQTKLHAPWWNGGVPFRWYDCRCVVVPQCATDPCTLEPGWMPDPPAGALYVVLVTSRNSAGESVTDHGPIHECH